MRSRWQPRSLCVSPVLCLLSPVLGFTLIEIVLVAVVMSVLLLVSIPKFQQTAARLRLEQTAFALTQLMRYTHEQAIAQGRDMVWVWEQATGRVRSQPLVTDPSHGGNLPAQVSEGVGTASVAVPEGISLTLTRDGEPVDCHCVRFFLDGTSEPTTLTVGDHEHAYLVTVDAATSHVVLSQGSATR